jgi:hypothetical protein
MLDCTHCSTANQLLAAILGRGICVPKQKGQKVLCILCLDGGGARGNAAISTYNLLNN